MEDIKRYKDIVNFLLFEDDSIDRGELLFKTYCREIKTRPNPMMINLIKHITEINQYDEDVEIMFEWILAGEHISYIQLNIREDSSSGIFIGFSEPLIDKIQQCLDDDNEEEIFYIYNELDVNETISSTLNIPIDIISDIENDDTEGLPESWTLWYVMHGKLHNLLHFYFPKKVIPWLLDIRDFLNKKYP